MRGFFLGDTISVRSRGSLALNNGCALRWCLVLQCKDRDGVEVLVEGGSCMSSDLFKEARSVAGLFDCGEL